MGEGAGEAPPRGLCLAGVSRGKADWVAIWALAEAMGVRLGTGRDGVGDAPAGGASFGG